MVIFRTGARHNVSKHGAEVVTSQWIPVRGWIRLHTSQEISKNSSNTVCLLNSLSPVPTRSLKLPTNSGIIWN